MKYNIASRIFFLVMTAFAFMFIFQIFILNKLAENIYYSSMAEDIDNTFKKYVCDYIRKSPENTGESIIKSYVSQYNSPVMILNDNYEMLYDDFFSEFTILTVSTSSGNEADLIVDYLKNYEDDPISRLNRGRSVSFEGFKIGNTGYYELNKIQITGSWYTNRDNIRNYFMHRSDTDVIFDYGYSKKIRIIDRDSNELNYKTKLLYNEIKPYIAGRADLSDFISEIRESDITDDYGNTYKIFARIEKYSGEDIYFLTLDNIKTFNLTLRYLNKYFMVLYLVFGLVSVGMALYLSKSISAPLIYLSGVAEKIAGLDFSVEADIKSKDQIGKLANNINIMSHNLERSVNELKMSNQKLKEKAVIKEENEKRMKRMLEDLAHEFKTPLGIISGFTEVIEHEIYEKDRGYYFDIINDEIGKLTDLVNDTIALSRLESGYYPLKLETVNIEDIISDVINKFEIELSKNNFRVNIDVKPYAVIADRKRIEQVLLNLLSNILKYSDESKPVNICALPTENHRIIIKVENYGTISEKDLGRIWSRYYMGENQSRINFKRDGIGLEIVRNILEQHKSEYGVINEDNIVSFYFTLELSGGQGTMLGYVYMLQTNI